MGFFDRKIGCGKAFTDEWCEDEYQFCICGKVDEEDKEIHYCEKCLKRKEKNDAPKQEGVQE